MRIKIVVAFAILSIVGLSACIECGWYRTYHPVLHSQ
jgi:hypothetical protein